MTPRRVVFLVLLALVAALARASPAPTDATPRHVRFDPPAGAVVDEVELPQVDAAHARLRRGSDLAAPLHVRFRALNRDYALELRPARGLFSPRFRAVGVDEAGREIPFEVDQRAFYRGHVAGEPDSAVHAHVHDGQLTALIRVGAEHVQVEPADTLGRDSPRHATHRVYPAEIPTPPPAATAGGASYCGNTDEHHVHAHTTHGSEGSGYGTSAGFAYSSASAFRARRVGAGGNPARTTCEMALISDHRYYVSDGGSVLLTTANKMIATLNYISTQIYAATDFDATQTGIELAVAYVKVYTSAATVGNPFVTSTSDATVFLNQLSGISWTGFCLAHAFTHQEFTGGVLGLAWVGTICLEWSGSSSQNTGISTSLNFGSAVPDLQARLVMAHEVGHNFGMSHDDNCHDYCLAHPSFCSGDTYASDSNGRYIMWPISVDGSALNNQVFSGCSRAAAAAKLQTQGSCFTDAGSGPICGNGIVQEGEQCDCGEPNDAALCSQRDPCCNTNCTLKAPAECSPQAGVCCNDNCTMRGYPLGTDLADPLLTDYACGTNTDCTLPTRCIRDPALNGTCPSTSYSYLGTTTLLYKPNGTLCNDGSNTCVSGLCTGSACVLYDATECSPPSAESACVVACNFNGTCISTADSTNRPENVTAHMRAAGRFCNDVGYCDGAGACVSASVDSPNVIASEIFNWAVEHWYVTYGIALGVVVLAFLLRCSYQLKDTSQYVKKHIRDFGSKAARVLRPRQSQVQAHGQKSAEEQAKFKQMAVFLEESERLRSSKLVVSSDEAFHRLTALFPHTPERVLREMIKASPHEEAAVQRLLTLGHPMRLVKDYKELVYATKIYERAHPPAEAAARRAGVGAGGAGAGPSASKDQQKSGSNNNNNNNIRYQRGAAPSAATAAGAAGAKPTPASAHSKAPAAGAATPAASAAAAPSSKPALSAQPQPRPRK